MSKLPSNFRRDLSDNLIQFVYTAFYKEVKSKLDGIVVSNAFINKTGDTWFVYKGQSYSNGVRPTRRAKTLARELTPKMDELLAEQSVVFEERWEVKNYLSCALMLCQCLGDARRVLPECLHSALQGEDSGQPPAVTAEVAANFNEQNKAAIQLIKSRLLINLIT